MTPSFSNLEHILNLMIQISKNISEHKDEGLKTLLERLRNAFNSSHGHSLGTEELEIGMIFYKIVENYLKDKVIDFETLQELIRNYEDRLVSPELKLHLNELMSELKECFKPDFLEWGCANCE